MRILYNIAIKMYNIIAHLASPVNAKARLWVKGRKGLLNRIAREVKSDKPCIWFHFASLGEFEQGRPVLEKIKQLYPGEKIIMTFFSPSGYELRKDYKLADHVFYLPIDTPSNARKFVSLINPRMAIFTKYEYWHNYLNELSIKGIPSYIISAIFRKDQVFFKWYGGSNRATLRLVTHFFVQDKFSTELLHTIGINNASVSGDTRFDRVSENAASPKSFECIERICAGKQTIVAGSTWPEDEKLIAETVKDLREWRFIIAPHEIKEDKLKDLEQRLPAGSFVRFSTLRTNPDHLSDNLRVIIIDNIGMLSSLYQYARIAYIGGGFGVGIHNTLEAAAYGIPVIFGPNFQKFLEAKALIRNGGGHSIDNLDELRTIIKKLNYPELYERASNASRDYVAHNKGATRVILEHLKLQ